jgi:hypothetical protein
MQASRQRQRVANKLTDENTNVPTKSPRSTRRTAAATSVAEASVAATTVETTVAAASVAAASVAAATGENTLAAAPVAPASLAAATVETTVDAASVATESVATATVEKGDNPTIHIDHAPPVRKSSRIVRPHQGKSFQAIVDKLPTHPVAPPFNVRHSMVSGAVKPKPTKHGVEMRGSHAFTETLLQQPSGERPTVQEGSSLHSTGDPRGMDIMAKVFENVNARDFRLGIEEDMTSHTVTVAKNATGSREYIVKLPKVAYNGSHFGTCTCGVPAKDGIPCQHMVVIVKSSNIPNVTRSSIMPFFWSTAQWQIQYSLDVDCRTDISINTLKGMARQDKKLRYCPDSSASNKPGRLKKSDKVMTLTDKMELASSGKKRKRQAKLYCQICDKWNHTTAKCFKNPINCNLEDTLGNISVTSNDKEGEEGSA